MPCPSSETVALPEGDARARRMADLPAASRLLSETESMPCGAVYPWQIPWGGWRAVLVRMVQKMISDRVSLVAAGCAFYATLALFPAISMLVSIYGLVFNPHTVEPQLTILSELLPPEAFNLIARRVHMLTTHHRHTLGIGLVISALVTFWSSAIGTKAVLSALNLAYGEREKRGFLRFQATGLLITLAAILGTAAGIGLMVGLPTIFAFFGLSFYKRALIRLASWGGLMLFVLVGLMLLYRYGPSRRQPRWCWVMPGALVATVAWLIASLLFAALVRRISSYDVTYGPIGAVAGVMMWFFVTVLVVLIGAELNAGLELQTDADTRVGSPPAPGDRVTLARQSGDAGRGS
jgi:membrane protein